jgi:hypothetical protein
VGQEGGRLNVAEAGRPRPMPEKTIKRRLIDARVPELAADDGPIFSTVAELVEALKRSIPRGNGKRRAKEGSSAPRE